MATRFCASAHRSE